MKCHADGGLFTITPRATALANDSSAFKIKAFSLVSSLMAF
jgi:hypothetical protein